MTKAEILKKYEGIKQDYAGYRRLRTYKEDTVFDEEKSVRWNREEVIRRNDSILALKKQKRKEEAQAFASLYADIVEYLAQTSRIDYELANKIYETAYDDKNSEGLKRTIDYAEELIMVYKLLLDCQGKV